MNKYIVREYLEGTNKYNAGNKARQDVEDIALSNGYSPLDCRFDIAKKRNKLSAFQRAMTHINLSVKWWKQLKQVPPKATVLFQFPVKAHTLFLGYVLRKLSKRSVKTIALVHDLDYVRNAIFYKNDKKKSFRLKYEEVFSVKQFDKIIVHNRKMKELISREFSISENKISSIEIFDYLIPQFKDNIPIAENNAIVIAGNLDKDKCAYIYKLPNSPMFELYGANYSEIKQENVHYNGAFPPDELPFNMVGKFGLVWDGDDTTTCSGIFGEYLKYNNPHKTSLYLACGIPVIVWAEAAIAGFIQKYGCGIITNSLDELGNKIASVNDQEYMTLKENAIKIGRRLRNGEFTKKQLEMIAEKE